MPLAIHTYKKTYCYFKNTPETITGQVEAVRIINPKIPVLAINVDHLRGLRPTDMDLFNKRRFVDLINTVSSNPKTDYNRVITNLECGELPLVSKVWVDETVKLCGKITPINSRVLQTNNDALLVYRDTISQYSRDSRFKEAYSTLLDHNNTVVSSIETSIAVLARRLVTQFSSSVGRVLLELYYRCDVNELVVLLCLDTALLAIVGHGEYLLYFQALSIDMHTRLLLKNVLYIYQICTVDYMMPSLYMSVTTIVSVAMTFYRAEMMVPLRQLLHYALPLLIPAPGVIPLAPDAATSILDLIKKAIQRQIER